MSRRFISFLTAALLCVAVLCAQAAGVFAADQTGKVTADVLNVRTGPAASYKIAAKIKHGEVYTIVQTQNGWGKLKSGTGWINLSYTKKV